MEGKTAGGTKVTDFDQAFSTATATRPEIQGNIPSDALGERNPAKPKASFCFLESLGMPEDGSPSPGTKISVLHVFHIMTFLALLARLFSLVLAAGHLAVLTLLAAAALLLGSGRFGCMGNAGECEPKHAQNNRFLHVILRDLNVLTSYRRQPRGGGTGGLPNMPPISAARVGRTLSDVWSTIVGAFASL